MIRYTGARIKRLEDPGLLRGRGQYIGDIILPGMLFVAFVRSPHAHATIRRMETTAALQVPGVVAVLTADDVRGVARPLAPRLEGGGFVPTAWPALADGVARFCGEAVAAVVATSPYVAADAREAVAVEYEPLAAVTDVDEALKAGRVLFTRRHNHGDVAAALSRAAVVIRESFRHERCAAVPIEPRGLIAEWDGQMLTLRASTQTPSILRQALAAALSLDQAAVRVLVPDVGGGFGLKTHVFPEDLAVAAIARMLGRPVKWIEERRENLSAASQAREQRVEIEAGLDREGCLSALRARVVSDAGAYHIYPLTQALEPLGTAAILPGPYRVPVYAYEAVAVATNKPPIGAYRGVGMTMGAFVMERTLDLLAERLGLDPVEIRRRNVIPREAYPFASASGLVYDSGDFPKALEHALALADYEGLRREQALARSRGRAIGVGIACYTEYTGFGSETYRRRGMIEVHGVEGARIRVEADGTVRWAMSFPSQGQGHATIAAQIIADRLGVALDRVTVERADTAASLTGSGTFASRGAVSLNGCAAAATEILRREIAKIAAQALEASPADIVLDDGHARVRGVPDRGLPLAEIAALARGTSTDGRSGAAERGLEATVAFDPPGPAFSGAVHVAMIEVDRETGRVSVKRYVVVEDCGPMINPILVEGQIHGAVAQGIGEALLERVLYDGAGQLLTATLMDYAVPRADDLPSFEIGHIETPSPLTPGGVKGMGEGGTIGAPAAIANAVADALRPSGVQITALPIRTETLAMARVR